MKKVDIYVEFIREFSSELAMQIKDSKTYLKMIDRIGKAKEPGELLAIQSEIEHIVGF